MSVGDIPASSGTIDNKRKLKEYYGLSSCSESEAGVQLQQPHATSKPRGNPLDIDGANFDGEAYMSQLLKRTSLQELQDKEHEMVVQIKQLDSEMQTLVYENYNKFIAATDTIRQMKTDFTGMEIEMDRLAQNMQKITQFSEKVSGSLQGRRENIQKLVLANNTLKNLQYIFDLPVKLTEYVERKEFPSAVNAYLKAGPVLEEHKTHTSFQQIHAECQIIISDLKDQLKEHFRSRHASTKELTSSAVLLLQLGEAPQSLLQDYLAFSEEHFRLDLGELEEQVSIKQGEMVKKSQTDIRKRPADAIHSMPMDILEFVDTSSSGFLSSLSLVIASYMDMFCPRASPLHNITSTAEQVGLVSAALGSEKLDQRYVVAQLSVFVNKLVTSYFTIVEQRFALEHATDDTSLVVRALDRFYRRLQALSKLIPDSPDFAESSVRIILGIARKQVELSRVALESQFVGSIVEARQILSAPRVAYTGAGSGGSVINPNQVLAEFLTKLEQQLMQNLKTTLANMLQFTASDVTFAAKEKNFLRPFGIYVRENLVAEFFRFVSQKCDDCASGLAEKAFVNSTVILLLSRLCVNLQASTIGYLLDLCEQQFRLTSEVAENRLSPVAQLNALVKRTAQAMIDRYVEMEGFALSQMLSKSVEARDWVAAVEPRSVRAVMKRVVEDLSTAEAKVAQLFEEGVRKDRSSDSSRRTAGMQSLSSKQNTAARQHQWATGAVSTENSLLKKLWSEKIDYFASVEFTKYSILTGIVKTYLWRFVSDENLVSHLLEEVMSSAALRCLEPTLMEPSVVEAICES